MYMTSSLQVACALVPQCRRPQLPRPRGYTEALGAQNQGPPEAASPVSADEAAAWLTGQPAYHTEWPECAGKCIYGVCALKRNHPACCFVRRHDTPDPDHRAASTHNEEGHWEGRDFFYYRYADRQTCCRWVFRLWAAPRCHFLATSDISIAQGSSCYACFGCCTHLRQTWCLQQQRQEQQLPQHQQL